MKFINDNYSLEKKTAVNETIFCYSGIKSWNPGFPLPVQQKWECMSGNWSIFLRMMSFAILTSRRTRSPERWLRQRLRGGRREPGLGSSNHRRRGGFLSWHHRLPQWTELLLFICQIRCNNGVRETGRAGTADHCTKEKHQSQRVRITWTQKWTDHKTAFIYMSEIQTRRNYGVNVQTTPDLRENNHEPLKTAKVWIKWKENDEYPK